MAHGILLRDDRIAGALRGCKGRDVGMRRSGVDPRARSLSRGQLPFRMISKLYENTSLLITGDKGVLISGTAKT